MNMQLVDEGIDEETVIGSRRYKEVTEFRYSELHKFAQKKN